jgi:hypothetical protein
MSGKKVAIKCCKNVFDSREDAQKLMHEVLVMQSVKGHAGFVQLETIVVTNESDKVR